MRNKIPITHRKSQILFSILSVAFGVLIIGSLVFYFDEIINSKYKFGDENLTETFFSNHDPISCTIFTSSYGDKVFFGNNEDWKNPKTYYWTVSPSNENYGVVYFGFNNFRPQGGINEKGLAFDVNALPETRLKQHPELPSINTAFYEFLKTCATVDEIIEKVKSFSWERSWKAQLHVADRMGNAVVISADQNGEIAFTRKGKDDGYLLSTNFNLANPENGKYPCWRFNTASRMLRKIEHGDTPTLENLQSILDAVHVEGAAINTVYSNIFDLTNGIIYLYHWHHYNEVVELKVAEEVTSEISPVRIKDLFSQETIDQASNEYLTYRKKITLWKSVAWFWLVVCGASVVIIINHLFKSSSFNLKIGLAWGLASAFFGPLGLVAYLYAYRQYLWAHKKGFGSRIWMHALARTVFNVTGYTIGVAAAMSTFYLILPLNESNFWSITARCYGLPLIIGGGFFLISLSVFNGGDKYWLIFRRNIISEIISFNLALAGILLVSGFLLDLSERQLGMDGPGDPVFWGVIALSGFSGTFIVYPFNLWIAHRRKNYL